MSGHLSSPVIEGIPLDPVGLPLVPVEEQKKRKKNWTNKAEKKAWKKARRKEAKEERKKRNLGKPKVKKDKTRGLYDFLSRKTCDFCNKNGLEVDLGMIYGSGSIICTGCEEKEEMDDGTSCSAWKIEGLSELYACGHFG